MEQKDYYSNIDISLLKKPSGTPMYLVRMNRMCTNVEIEEVKYIGFNKRWQKEHFEDVQPKCEFDYEQEYFDIMFQQEPYMDYLTITERWNGWTGLRGYDTDEHEAVGVLRGDYIDAYFTTSLDSLTRYLEKKNISEKLKEEESRIKKIKRTLKKFIQTKNVTNPNTCTLDIYELVPVVKYKEKWGMQFVDLDNPSPLHDEVLIERFPLKLMNAHTGELYNYKDRSYEPDHWVRDFSFDVEISDDLYKFLYKIKNSDNYSNRKIEKLINGKDSSPEIDRELQFFAENWLAEGGEKKGFCYAGSGTFADEYPLTKTDHYVVKLKIDK